MVPGFFESEISEISWPNEDLVRLASTCNPRDTHSTTPGTTAVTSYPYPSFSSHAARTANRRVAGTRVISSARACCRGRLDVIHFIEATKSFVGCMMLLYRLVVLAWVDYCSILRQYQRREQRSCTTRGPESPHSASYVVLYSSSTESPLS